MTDQTLVPPDRHGRGPRMHYDEVRQPSPTTRADLVTWCVAQRQEHAVSVAIQGVVRMTMTAVMKGRAQASRLEHLPAAILGAIEAAADDLHLIVREFGYDPTGIADFSTSCLAIVMERIAPLAYDLTRDGEPLADALPSRDGLHQVIGMAAVGTTLATALAGWTSPRTMLDALLLAFDESHNPEIKDVLSEAAIQLKQAIDRKREE